MSHSMSYIRLCFISLSHSFDFFDMVCIWDLENPENYRNPLSSSCLVDQYWSKTQGVVCVCVCVCLLLPWLLCVAFLFWDFFFFFLFPFFCWLFNYIWIVVLFPSLFFGSPWPSSIHFDSKTILPYTHTQSPTSLHRTKHLPSHGYQIIQSSATYLSRAVDAPVYKLWVVVSSVRALRGQVSGYWCYSYGVLISFTSSVIP